MFPLLYATFFSIFRSSAHKLSLSKKLHVYRVANWFLMRFGENRKVRPFLRFKTAPSSCTEKNERFIFIMTLFRGLLFEKRWFFQTCSWSSLISCQNKLAWMREGSWSVLFRFLLLITKTCFYLNWLFFKTEFNLFLIFSILVFWSKKKIKRD